MLAQTATSVADALERHGGATIFEAKLDGARVQIHRSADEVTVYTRSLDDVTARLPEVVAATLALPVTELIADGEAIALRPDNRPHRFQVTASRFGRSVDVASKKSRAVAAQPLSVFFFDILHRDGVDLLDAPTTERLAALDALVPPRHRVDRLATSDPSAAAAFLEATLAAGHEGVMAKSPDAPYQAGRRGAGWLKVKPVHTLDLVVLAVEWGSGRRRGKLSNIHLGARDPVTGEFIMVGKTFKGMTDAMLDWQTARFSELAVGGTEDYVVQRAPRAGGRNRVGRGAEIDALPRRAGAAVCPGGPLPRRQEPRPKPTPSTPCARCTEHLQAGCTPVVVGFDRDCGRERFPRYPVVVGFDRDCGRTQMSIPKSQSTKA